MEIDDSYLLILDTNIFLLGIDLNVLKSKAIYTTPQVIDEIKEGKKNRNIITKVYAAIESGKLKILNPSMKYLDKITEESIRTGDYKALSSTDLELIALILELRNTISEEIILYTNDYTMQNLCTELDLPFASLLRKGIKVKITWEIYCPFCKDKYPSEFLNTICEQCGSKLKRRPKKN